MTAAGHGADAWFAARKLGVKTVAKSAAKRTAKGVIHKWSGTDGRPGVSSNGLTSSSKQGVQPGTSGSLAASGSRPADGRIKPASSGSLGGGGAPQAYRAGL